MFASFCYSIDPFNLSDFKMNLIADSNKLHISGGNRISCYHEEVVSLFHCQVVLKYSYQLIVIHKRGFSEYLHVKDSAEKMGRRLNLQTYS